MNNFEHATEATNTAINSNGSAWSENEAVVDSVQGKLSQLQNTFEELSNNVINSDLVKGVLDIANAFLQLVNTPVGTFIVQVTLATTALYGLSQLIQSMKFVGSIVGQFKNFGILLKNIWSMGLKAGVGATAAATGVKTLGIAINTAIPIIGLIVAGITAAVAIFDHFNESIDEQKEKVQQLSGELATLEGDYNALISKGNLTEAEQRRLELLEAQIRANEILLDQENKRLFARTYGADSTLEFGDEGYFSTPGNELNLTGTERLQKHIDQYNKYQKTIKETEDEILSLDKSSEDYAKRVQLLTKEKDRLTTSSVELAKEITTEANEIVEITGGVEKLTPEMVAALGIAEGWFNSLSEGDPVVEGIKTGTDSLTESTINFADKLSELEDAYNNIKAAQDEYNETGKISVETLHNLLSLGPQYIQSLMDEQGQIDLNRLSTYDYEQQLFWLAEQMAQESVAAYAAQRAQELFGDSAIEAKNDADDLVIKLGALGAKYDETAAKAIAAAAANQFALDPDDRGTQKKLSELEADVEAYAKSMTNLLGNVNFGFGGRSSDRSSSGSSKKATDPIKEQSDAFKELNEIIEHNIFLREKQGAGEQELISLYKDYQKQLNKEANWFRSQGLDDNSEYIRELQKQWWNLEEEISSVYDEIAKDAEKAAEKAKKAWEEAMEAQIGSLEKRQNAYETLFSLVSDMAQDEIDALEKQRTAVEEYWQRKIDALEQANKELEEQIEKEEALDALARARQGKVMVYKDGRFQYLQDIDKVSEAQANLEKIEREETLKKELENLEKLRDEELASIDKQIEGWEEYKEAWSSVVDNYQEEQDRLLVEQKLGIKLEGENWQTRLDNLSSYVKQYKDLMAQLSGLQSDLENENIKKNQKGELIPGVGSLAGTGYTAWAWVPGSGYTPVTVKGGKTQETDLPVGTIIYGDDKAWVITGGKGGSSGYTSKEYGPTPEDIWTPKKEASVSGGGGGGATSSSSGRYQGSSVSGGSSYNIGSQAGKDFINNAKPGATLTGGDGSSWTKNPDGSTTISRGNNTWVVPANANGTLSSIGGLSLVGEKGPELRVLNEGDGVIPSEVTKNLWAWGATSPASMMSNIVGGLQSMGQQIGITIQNFNPNLPNVQDGQGFANYMRTNFWREAIQFAKV